MTVQRRSTERKTKDGLGRARADRGGAPTPLNPIEAPTSHLRAIAPYLLVFVLALAIRLLYLLEMRDTLLFEVILGDGRSYDQWARRIAGGEWFGDRVFFQAPFYPYFLAVLYRLFGDDLTVVRVAQCVLGSFSCVFIALAGRSFFSKPVGLAAGVLLALYSPAIFFDGLMQKASLSLFFTSMVIFLLAQLMHRMRWSVLLFIGMVLGCYALTRENALILIPLIVGWLLVHQPSESWARRGAYAAVFASGVAIVLLPVGFRNEHVGGKFLLTTSQLGINLYLGNNINADGRYHPLRARQGSYEYEQTDTIEIAESALGRSLTPSEVSGYWVKRTTTYIGENPGHWLRLMARKWFMVWNAREEVDTDSIEANADQSVLLRALYAMLHFGVLCPLAAVGVWATRSHWRRLWILYATAFLMAAGMAVFLIYARYRFPLVAVVVLFASAGLHELLRSLRMRQVNALSMAVAIAAVTVVAVHPSHFAVATPHAITYLNLGFELLRMEKYDDALSSYALAEALQGESFNAQSHFYYATALEKTEKPDKARQHYERALRIDPTMTLAHVQLASLDLRDNRFDDATAHYQAAAAVDPANAKVKYLLGQALDAAGKHDEALDQYRLAENMAPDEPLIILAAARSLDRLKNTEDAVVYYRRLVQLAPDHFTGHTNLGIGLRNLGRPEEARRHLAAAVDLNPESADAHHRLSLILRELGETDKADHHLERAQALRNTTNGRH